MASFAALNEQFGIPGVLAFDEPHPGFVRARITMPACTAELFLYGAHLTAWQPTGAEPVLFLSPNSFFEPGKPIRGGVPVIFPWFGPRTPEVTGARTDGPSHGFARTTEWALQFAAITGDDLHLALTLAPDDTARALGFHHFRVALEFTLGRTLTMRMTVGNEGSEPLVYEQALHTYFHVGDIAQTIVHGLEHTEYIDKPGGFQRKQQGSEPIVFAGEVDRPYLNTTADATIEDRALNRRITISKGGSQTTVVWNPGEALAARTADIGVDVFRRYVCVETANAADNRITLAPRSAHVMESRINLA
jgi:glucose-6-phosphate 1-epimerase